jgi:haloalkane dehalogenase
LKILRTPDKCFHNLPDYDFEPHYTVIKDDDGSEIRIHHVDEGPRDAQPILLMHGNPTWSYLYRKMIPELVKTGRRVIAVDLVGCGRSDKPSKKKDYTLGRHCEWMSKWLRANELNNISLFCQDWGGTIGLNLVAQYPERFDRVIASNTGIPRGDGGNKWLKVWLFVMRFAPLFPWSFAFRNTLQGNPSKEELYAYEKAPFPNVRFQAGITKFPQLITIFPDNPELSINLKTWEKLECFEKPFLTVFGDRDPVSRGGERRFQKRVPGAQGQNHKIIAGAGHFIQEDVPELLVIEIVKFLDVN